MKIPIITDKLLEQLEAISTKFTEERLRGLMHIPGNPMGVQIKKFGKEVTAFLYPEVAIAAFNSVSGISEESMEVIEDVVAFYEDSRVPFQCNVLPGNMSEILAIKLSLLGFSQVDFYSMLYCIPEPDAPKINPSIKIHEVKTYEEFDIFMNLHQEGFEVPDEDRAPDYKDMRFWLESDGWHLFTAALNGKPAGTAIFYTHNNIGYLAASATIPDSRRKGIHLALIKHRLHFAFETGCGLVCTETAFSSDSQRNMERACMRIACTKSIWKKLF